MTRQTEQYKPVLETVDSVDHIIPLGKMIEEMELNIRKSIDIIYVSKTREVIAGLRSLEPEVENVRKDLFSMMSSMHP